VESEITQSKYLQTVWMNFTHVKRFQGRQFPHDSFQLPQIQELFRRKQLFESDEDIKQRTLWTLGIDFRRYEKWFSITEAVSLMEVTHLKTPPDVTLMFIFPV
jgi:hypothetical protein